MNSWKLNGKIGHLAREAICNKLEIPQSIIYRAVKTVDNQGNIITFDDEKYKLTLTKIENEQNTN